MESTTVAITRMNNTVINTQTKNSLPVKGISTCVQRPKRCVSLEDLCSDFNECTDEGIVEMRCPRECQPTEFQCSSNPLLCVPKKALCDNVKDCKNGSDEVGCGNYFAYDDCKGDPELFQCQDHSDCLFPHSVCDGHDDCDDGSDEKNNCADLCLKLECEHSCFPSVEGVKCMCDEGYSLEDNGKTCHSGEAILYYANVSEIWSLTLETRNSSRLIADLHEISGLAVDSHGGRIFWSEIGVDKQGVYFMDTDVTDNERHTVISYGLVKPMGLAFDYITRNLYIADMHLPAIIACELTNKFCDQVFNSSVVSSPRDIALYPSKGLMYWTEVGERPAIMKGGMNGVGSEVLVSKRVRRPVSLFLDLTIEKLYWIDSFLNEVFSINLDGSNKVVILGHKISSPVGIIVFEDDLIWANGKSPSLMVANKFKGYGARALLEDVSKSTALAIEHKSLQYDSEFNYCHLRYCHLCLLGPEDPSCLCSPGYILDFDERSCHYVQLAPFLLAIDGSQIIKINITDASKTSVLKTNSAYNIFALAYLSKAQQILYSDSDDGGNVFVKQLSDIDSRYHSVTLLTDITSIQSMAVDEAASTIFWVDSIKKTIEVSAHHRFRATLPVFGGNPMYLAVNSEEGALYFIDLYPATIQQCRLDGTNCSPLVKQRLEEPNYLVYSNQKLFWSDRSLREISFVNLKTRDLSVLVLTNGQPSSFAVYGGLIYWTEVEADGIFYKHIARLDGHKGRIDTEFSHLTGLALASLNLVPSQSTCAVSNGGCNHICISGKNFSHTCLCSNGYHLDKDGKNCLETPKEAAKKCDFFCQNEQICISSDKICNKISDCADGSDEAGCVKVLNCDASEFKCDDGQCVPKSECDGVFDCQDKSDEKPEICPSGGKCPPEELKCDGFCLAAKYVCDGSMDCENGTDESSCPLTCADDEFKCNICVGKDWRCDGEEDCLQGEDEQGCGLKKCSAHQFECSDKKCIDKQEVCDGVDDCDDGEDERRDCVTPCGSGQFTCSDRKCIDDSLVCNGASDCRLGEDEDPWCYECEIDELKCSDDSCIPLDRLCDGVRDCPDGLDELTNCPSPHPPMITNPVKACDGFRCKTGQCLVQSKRCDGKPQCQDNSDEMDCAVTCREFHQCEHSCVDTSAGPWCVCKKGFKLVGNYACRDIDECLGEDVICSQDCDNLKGAVDSQGFKCLCRQGYIQTGDLFSCKVKGHRPVLYASSFNSIRRLSVNGQDESVLVSNITPPSMMDIDVHDQSVYWVDGTKSSTDGFQSVKQQLWKKTHNKPKVSVLSGFSLIDFAVDWLTKNIYISHIKELQRCITVFSESNYEATIVSESSWSPGRIVLHPLKGLMFWVSEHRHPAQLIKSWMDGSSRRVIADVLPHRKSMLALDPKLDQLYWYDLYSKKIVSADLFGNKKRSFEVANMRQIHSLDVFESILYMTNTHDNSIMKFPMYGSKENRKLARLAHARHSKFIKVVHPLRQPLIPMSCDKSLCQYMCVLSVSGPVCICPNGYKNPRNPHCIGSRVESSSWTPQTSPDVTVATTTGNCSQACQNEGVCVTNGTHHMCRCVPGFRGDFCELIFSKKDNPEEEKSLIWIVGLVVAILFIALLVVGVTYYVRNKRHHPGLMRAIRFKKASKYIVTSKDDTEGLVPEISFNNPGFQDEIDEEADLQNSAEWWRKLLARSQKSVDDAFQGKGNNGKCLTVKGGMPQDPNMADKVSLLKNI